MEEQKFEDLVIDNNSKKNKQKQMIFKFIVFLIFILIFSVIYKIFTGSSSRDLPVVDSVEKQQGVKEEFEELKAKNDENFDNFNSTLQKLKNDNSIVETEDKKTEDTQAVNNVDTSNQAQQNVVTENTTIKTDEVKEVEKPEPKQVEPKKTEPKKVVANEQKAPSKKVVNDKKVKKETTQTSVFDTIDVKKPSQSVVKNQNLSTNNSGGSFIQVYASKNIDLKSHEIKKLDNLGLKYKVVTDDKGMSRVIVGPYSNSDKANALKYIRENVRKDAFYYHAK